MGEQDVKDRHVIFDILPCVVITILETDAFMVIVVCIDMLMVRRNQKEVEEREYSRSSCDSETWRSPRLRISKIQIQRSLFYGKLGK